MGGEYGKDDLVLSQLDLMETLSPSDLPWALSAMMGSRTFSGSATQARLRIGSRWLPSAVLDPSCMHMLLKLLWKSLFSKMHF